MTERSAHAPRLPGDDRARVERVQRVTDHLAELGPAVAAAALVTGDPRWDAALLCIARARQALLDDLPTGGSEQIIRA